MKLVLDNNIFFALMKPDSSASYLLSSLKTEFFLPRFAKFEFDEHKAECLSKSELSEDEFEIRLEEVEKNVRYVEDLESEKHFDKALESSPDPDDVPYIAAALTLKAAVWSNDPHLKQQSIVKAYTTAELIEELLNDRL